MNTIVLDEIERMLIGSGIAKHTGLLVAYSGGRDSTVLVHAIRKLGYSAVHLVYLDHQLRESGERRNERALVRRFAAQTGYPLTVAQAPRGSFLRTSEGVESAARRYRYGLFARELSAVGYCNLVTAHHLDDRVETVLMKILRGNGAWGSAGIPAIGPVPGSDLPNTTVLRPLLTVDSAEIQRYASDENLEWAEDSSNATTRFTRNAIRIELAPILERIDPGYRRSILRLDTQLSEMKRTIAEVADRLKWRIDDPGVVSCSRSGFRKLPLQARYYALRSGMVALGVDPRSLHYNRLAPVAAELGRDDGPTNEILPGTIASRVDGSRIVLHRSLARPVRSGYLWYILPGMHLGIRRDTGEPVWNLTPGTGVRYGFSGLEGRVVIRSHRPEDRISVDGNSRSVQGSIGTSGVPAVFRDLVPVLEDESGVAVVFGTLFGGNDLVRDDITVDSGLENWIELSIVQ